MGVEQPARRRGLVVVGRPVPTLREIVVVALIAAAAGLMLGWHLAGGDRSNALPTSPLPSGLLSVTNTPAQTPSPLVRAAAVDPALRRAYAEKSVGGSWLVCASAETFDCLTAEPVRLSPSAAFGGDGLLSQLSTGTWVPAGGRISVVAGLPYAVGVSFVLVNASGVGSDVPEVTAAGGVHYLDLGVLAPGRYTLVAEAELGPPAGGLVEAATLQIASR